MQLVQFHFHATIGAGILRFFQGRFALAQVSVDLFCLTQSYVDVATLGTLTYVTSGQLYLYQPFKQDTHGNEFYNDLRWNIIRPQVLEKIHKYNPFLIFNALDTALSP